MDLAIGELVLNQVAALRQAGESGVPFCAKCEEALEQETQPAPSPAAIAQAETLQQASESGIPFCAKCEEAEEAEATQ
jgi:hypothetical protein